MDKVVIIPEIEVHANLNLHAQKYGILFLPPEDGLPEKLVLRVSTDVNNSLRFMHEHDVKTLLENLAYSCITFSELKLNPRYKEQFRLAQLDDILQRIRAKCIREWREPIKFNYSRPINTY